MDRISLFWVFLTILSLVSSYEDYYGRNFENQDGVSEQEQRHRDYYNPHPNVNNENREERRSDIDPYRTRSDPYSAHERIESHDARGQDVDPYYTSTDPNRGHFSVHTESRDRSQDGQREEVDPYRTRSDPYSVYNQNENREHHREDIDAYRTSTGAYSGHLNVHPDTYGENRESYRDNLDPYRTTSESYDAFPIPQSYPYHSTPARESQDPYARSYDSYERSHQPHDYTASTPRTSNTFDPNEIHPHYDSFTPQYTTTRSYESYHQQFTTPSYGRHEPTNRYDPYRRDDYDRDSRRQEPAPRVSLPYQGSAVGGVGHTSWTGRKFYTFLGIKYAHVGKGDKRFQKPEPVRPWTSEFNATVEPPACPSFPNLNKIQREERLHDIEDCLSVSIYTPDLQGRFPVMFYIHGEFFFDGNSQEAKPEYLLEKDVVLVSVEYRLAPFGFLSTLTERLPGNAAVTDVIAALEWVQKNILYFGGDSRKVTIFGQGAGASMAHLLSISPYVSTNLFHQVIIQSGTALNPYLITSNPIRYTTDIARRAGCTTTTSDDIADCLSRISTSEVLRAFLKHCQENEPLGVGNFGGFQLVIGDYYNIIPDHPYKLASKYDGVNYLIIGGVTKDVGSFFFSKIFPYIQRSPKRDLDSLIDVVLKHTVGDEDEYGIWKNLIAREIFTEEQRTSQNLEVLAPGLIDLVSAVLYKAPLLEALQQNAKFDPNGTYLYSFDYEGKHKRYRFTPFPFDLGVTLSDDNIYLFPYPDYVSSLDEEDQEIAGIMVDLWTSFASTGVPRTRKLNEWPQMHLVTGPYINIGDDGTDIDVSDNFVGEFSASQTSASVSKILQGLTRISDLLERPPV